MDSPFQSDLELEGVDPEVRAHIYQSLLDLSGFTTPETVVSVVARTPREKKFRVSISLKESGVTIQDEGECDDLFGAIVLAKNKLLKHLSQMHDEAITQQERLEQIQNLMTHHQIH